MFVATVLYLQCTVVLVVVELLESDWVIDLCYLLFVSAQVRMSTFKFVFLPALIPSSRSVTADHWILLLADTTTRTVTVLNSLNNVPSYESSAQDYLNLFQ